MPRRACLALALATNKSNSCIGFLLPTRKANDPSHSPPSTMTRKGKVDDVIFNRSQSASDDDDGVPLVGGGKERDGRRGSHHHHRWEHEPFDYSSRLGWDKFYEKNNDQEPAGVGGEHDDASSIGGSGVIVDDAESSSSSSSFSPSVYEWHSHIPHSAIIDAIRPSILMASSSSSSSRDDDDDARRHVASILLVGCGNSALPRYLNDAFVNVVAGDVRVTCLDYSPVCIETMKLAYGKNDAYSNIDFVVGDATNLGGVIWNAEDCGGRPPFDVVIDKGLLDALMCGEGHDVERLMSGINDVLTPNDWGMHVLICFPLSASMRRTLEGTLSAGGLAWDFDVIVDGSENGRATFNMARRRIRGR